MEDSAELESILPYLPLVIGSSRRLLWPSKVVEALEAMSRGPDHSRVNCGEVLSIAISDMRASLSLADPLALSAPLGYALFFDELMSGADSRKWFAEDIPKLANLLLRLPSLLEVHYQNSRAYGYGLRILGPQQPGMVLLSQELIGALLACSLFCLFPISNRGLKHLPTINFDQLFASLYDSYSESQENKVRCIICYFQRICLQMPTGSVSFERKLLSLEHHPWQSFLSYPYADFWTKSTIRLCPFQVHSSGLIEDHAIEALEVDFANKYLGGGALHRGCVQEEIRFMINPELIAGMLFLPSMADNEAIEIVGAERFSDYTGYASSFRFSGDYVDKRSVDFLGRRKTRIVAIDALCSPRMKQYKPKYLLRETNKAFCGFLDQSKYSQYKRLFKMNSVLLNEGSSLPIKAKGESRTEEVRKSDEKSWHLEDCENYIGIATGNWGCGAFGGDPEVKTIIQWLAASQALRPFISYYTFGLEALQSLAQVTQWIILQKWNVGDLWNILIEYSCQKLRGEADVGFFAWLLPSLPK
ncbi:poly(ADP-ribose) glycohydrolase 1-like isoform X1 [Gossypium arboreum]|uniref:poly(ADP-ribose) glycohydrolase 1-like isoform X1 n=1 Tax=Gossypium arboreum TaxID=29729 RepID=UPI0022F1C616|nr:poly(ADP-ribose) glycohydrolase 1-like isoform X1 [Gossypium arboreum]